MVFGVSASVKGADELARLAKAVKATGDGQLRKDMLAGVRKAAKPAAEAVRDEYRDGLPHGGGLNEWVASSKFAPRTRTSGKSAGVRVVATKKGHDLEAVERGEVRHPNWGNRSSWSTTNVTPGLGERGFEKAKPRVLDELHEVLDDTAARIARSV